MIGRILEGRILMNDEHCISILFYCLALPLALIHDCSRSHRSRFDVWKRYRFKLTSRLENRNHSKSTSHRTIYSTTITAPHSTTLNERMIHLRSNISIQLDIGHASQFKLRVDSCLLSGSNDRFSDSDGHFSNSFHVGVEQISVSLVGRERIGESLSGGLDEVFRNLRSVRVSQACSAEKKRRVRTNRSDTSENGR